MQEARNTAALVARVYREAGRAGGVGVDGVETFTDNEGVALCVDRSLGLGDRLRTAFHRGIASGTVEVAIRDDGSVRVFSSYRSLETGSI